MRNPKNSFVNILITQFICISALLVLLTIIKYFFTGTFWNLKGVYQKYFLTDTETNEVTDSDIL